MIETHPFELFVPKQARYLLLGSFTGKMNAVYDWYYSNGRNQFWLILEKVYGMELKTIEAKKALFTELGLGVGDIIYQCERKKGNNADTNLVNIVYNFHPVEKVLSSGRIKKIYFSSRFVELKFLKVFKEIIERYPLDYMITLPSPSPRFAAMSRDEKIDRYKELLPTLEF